MNSNNENNNEGLNAVSLGSVDNTNQNLNVPVNDIPPVEPVPMEPETLDLEPANLNATPLETVPPVAPIPVTSVSNQNEGNLEGVTPAPVMDQIPQGDSIPDINAIPSEIPPVAPINYDIPEVIDNTPVFNDIGTVPPITNGPVINTTPIAEPESPKSKKKGMNKTLFVLIIILALAAVGVGVYIILNKAQAAKPVVILKNVKIELNSDISTDIDDYATFRNIDSSTCNFDTTEITDTKVLGAEYKFRIHCGQSTYTGKATIVDTIAPEVTLKEVNVGIGDSVIPDDFIADCKDASNCTYEFKDEEKVKENLKEASSYHVDIVVKDEAGNIKEVTGTLNVTESAPVSTISLVCSKTNDSYVEVSKFGLTDGSFNKSTVRNYVFTFKDKASYDAFKAENSDKSEVTYSNVTGTPTFADDELELTLSKKISYSDLNTELGSSIPDALGELRTLVESKGYSCRIGY